MLEFIKTNILLKQKLYDLAKKWFQESLNKKAAQINEHTEQEKLVKQLQVMRVEIDIRRAEAMQLSKLLTPDNMKNWKDVYMHSLLMLKTGTLNTIKNTQFSMLNEEKTRPDFLQFTIQQPTILKRIRNGHKNVHVSFGLLMQRKLKLEKLIEEQIKTIRTFDS